MSVLTTCDLDKSLSQGAVAGTLTVSWVGRIRAIGISGPPLTTPADVAMNKLTSEPRVKFRPVRLNLSPTRITPGMLVMTGVPGTDVAVAFGVGVRVGV